MKADEKEVNRKKRILNHASQSGNTAKTCRYFGIPRSLFYVWLYAYRKLGDEGVKRKKSAPKTHPDQTPDDIVEKIYISGENIIQGPHGSCGIWLVII